jgi:hypothetical protein
MRTKKMLVISGVVLIVIAAVGAGLYAQQKNAGPRKLSAEDWIEIRQLYSRYPIYIDRITDNGDEFANLWIEDGVWDTSPTAPPRRGRKEIAAAAVKVSQTNYQGGNSLRRHYSSINVLIDPSPEGAVGTSYFSMMKSSAKEGQASEVEFNGVYNDVFVKTKDGWKFKSRVWRRGPGIGISAPATPAR